MMTDDDVKAWLDAAPATVMGAAAPFSKIPVDGARSFSSGIVTGDAAPAALKFMADMRAKYGGKPDPTTMDPDDLEKFLDSIKTRPSVGVTTISTVSLKKSGWSPDPTDDKKNMPKNFLNYLDILSKAPCMTLRDENKKVLNYKEKNYNELIEKAAEMLEAATGGDKGKIKTSLTGLAQTALSNVNTEQREYMFSQNAIPLDAATTGYHVYLTQTTMKQEKGKAAMMQSSITVYWLKLEFSTELWEAGIYRSIGKRVYEDADDWLTATNPTLPDDAPKPCFAE